MKVLFLGDPLNFYLIPREYPVSGDTLTLSLRDEFKDTVITPAVTWALSGKWLLVTITAQPAGFKTQKRYEATLSNGADVIYYGKIIVLDSGTDVQNYEYKSQTNARFDYKT